MKKRETMRNKFPHHVISKMEFSTLIIKYRQHIQTAASY